MHICAFSHCVKSVQIRSFFLVCIFPHLDWIRRDTEYLSVVSLNARKYRPKKTLYLDTFHTVPDYFSFSHFFRWIPVAFKNKTKPSKIYAVSVLKVSTIFGHVVNISLQFFKDHKRFILSLNFKKNQTLSRKSMQISNSISIITKGSSRGVFETPKNINDGAFLRKYWK